MVMTDFIVFYDELGFFENGKDVIALDLLDKQENNYYDVLVWLSKEALDFQLRTLGKLQPQRTCCQKFLERALYFGCDSVRCTM